MARRRVAILGSTGSIGTQTLDVVAAEAAGFEIVALGAGSSVELLAAQAQQVRPQVVGLADDTRAAELQALLPPGLEVDTWDGRAWVGLIPFSMRRISFTHSRLSRPSSPTSRSSSRPGRCGS